MLASDPQRLVIVERATVGIVAEARTSSVRVTAGVDGTALAEPLIDRLRRARPEEPLTLWDGRTLTLLSVKPELRAALDVLKREGNMFPAESHGPLIALLSKWAQRLPVAMPRSVMGRAAPALTTPVLRFEVEPAGSVVVEVRVRPLAEGPALEPGRGVRDVHVRVGDDALHTVRAFREEEDSAKAFAAELPLEGAEPDEEHPFRWTFPNAEGALLLLEACGRREPPPELEWVGKPLRNLGARAAPALKVTVERRRGWFGLIGGLSVEGERIDLARLLDATRKNQRFVEVLPAAYVEISPTLRERLKALLDHVHQSKRGVEVGPSAVHALHAVANAGATLEADDEWLSLARRVTPEPSVAEVPNLLATQLRSYQAIGFRWLVNLALWNAGGVLADDMGLGKTVQALALLLYRREEGPALVVAPTSVAFNWQEEASRFAPTLRIVRLGDADDRNMAIETLGPGDVLLVGYGLLAREHERLASRRFGTIVFDEAHLLKNANTVRARAARQLRGALKVALTGTPVENHLGELWGLFAAVFPALFGSWAAFSRRYAMPIEKHDDPEARGALARVLTPFLLRRTKPEVESELPPRTDVRVPVVLSSGEWQLYEDARLATLSDLHSTKRQRREQERRVEVLAALTRLRLLASHPKLSDPRSSLPSSKLERFLALAEELVLANQRALVFSQFTSHLALVRKELDTRKIPYVYLDGQTPEARRKDRVVAFQTGDAPFFLVSLKAGGVGINLTAATTVIHLDPWWNPAVEDQATDRAHRPGQTRPVTVYRLIAMGTIEEKMLELHEQKRELVAQVLAEKGSAGSVTVKELLALVGSA